MSQPEVEPAAFEPEDYIVYPPNYETELAKATALQARLATEGLAGVFGVSDVGGLGVGFRPVFFGFVMHHDRYGMLVEQENAHFRSVHEADERFDGQPPPPGQEYEPSGMLSIEEMLRQHRQARPRRTPHVQLAIYHEHMRTPFVALAS